MEMTIAADLGWSRLVAKTNNQQKKLFKYVNNIKTLKQKLHLPSDKLVPCHNDLIAENILNQDNQIFIVDFDYSGNNDPCFELGNLSVEMEYDDEQINRLVRCYYGEINENIISRVWPAPQKLYQVLS